MMMFRVNDSTVTEIAPETIKENNPKSGMFVCISDPDRLSGFTHGTVYMVENGMITNDNGKKIEFKLEGGDLFQGIYFGEIKGLGRAKKSWTGVLYCVSSADFHIFKPGFIYFVNNGEISDISYNFFIKADSGKEYCEKLEAEFPATFIHINSTKGV